MSGTGDLERERGARRPHVAFVAPEREECRPFLRGLERVGARVTGIGELRPEHVDSELRYLLERYVYVRDLEDDGALLAALRRLALKGPVDRLECVVEVHLEAVARARVAARIAGPGPDAVALTRDKLRLKRFLARFDVATAPTLDVAEGLDAARAFGRRVGYPLILKPRGGSALQHLSRIDGEAALLRALSAPAVAARPGAFSLEKFADGHEGFIDGLVCDGEIVFEAATHFYPPVLEALRTRWISPHVVHTNRLAHEGYDELRALNRRTLEAVGLGTVSTATHLEWFHGPHGRWVSELGLHPPPFRIWDLYCEAGEFDLYTEWARAVCRGRVEVRGVARKAAGMISLRPDRDGVVSHYEGVERMQRRYGELIFRMHLPPPGTPTQPIESGYLANAYVCVRHPDYDVLRQILADIGDTVRMHAR